MADSDMKAEYDFTGAPRGTYAARYAQGVRVHVDGVQVGMCGPSTAQCSCQCPDGPCDHKFDGPWEEWDDGKAAAATCSRCGMDAESHDVWVAP